MLDLGRHAEFIWASYAIAALVVLLLVAWLLLDGRRHARALAELETRGIRRRSAGDGGGPGPPSAATARPTAAEQPPHA